MVDMFLVSINTTMAIFAISALVVFWLSWRKRPDFIHIYIALIFYTIGHIFLVIQHYFPLFKYLGNGVILLALLIIIISSTIEYVKLFVTTKKEKIIFGITIVIIVIFSSISIVLFHVFQLLILSNAIMLPIIFLLISTTFFQLRMYHRQHTITKLYIFSAYVSATFTAITAILATYFEAGLAVNIAMSFLFQTVILTGGLSALSEKRVTLSEEKYRLLSEQLEEKVTERTQQLELANKELESFSYSVSHDLRTPLRSIAGFAKILHSEYELKLGEDGLDYLKRILKNTDRMNDLINDMLDLAQVSRADFIIEPLNLSEMAYDIMINLRQMDTVRHIEFTIEENIVVQGDSKLLRIVLENLLGNAMKFTRTTSNAMINFGSTMKDDKPVYYIKDNGVGFDMKYYEKLFGLFQRLHSSTKYEGTGIGLITVQRIIEKHNGEIWAVGVPNKGATFYFTLS